MQPYRPLKHIYTVLLSILAWQSLTAQTANKTTLPALQQQIKEGKADTSTVTLLLDLSGQYIRRSGELKSDLDSATLIAHTAEQLSINLKYKRGQGYSNVMAAYAYGEMKQLPQQRISSLKALATLNTLGFLSDKADAYVNLASSYTNRNEDFPEKIRLFDTAASLFRQAGKIERQASIKEIIGDLYQVHDNYSQSLKILNEALTLYQSIGFKRLEGVYDLIGTVHAINGDYVSAVEYSLLAAQTGEELKDSSSLMGTIYNRIGIIYAQMNNYDKGLTYFQKARDISLKFSNNSDLRAIQENMADMLNKTGRYQASLSLLKSTNLLYPDSSLPEQTCSQIIQLKNYVGLKQMNNAEHTYQQLLQMYNLPNGELIYKQWIRSPVIEYLQTTGQYNKTYPYLEAYQKNMKNKGDIYKYVRLELLYFKSDSALGHLSGALHHYQQYKTYSDSVFNIAKTRQLTQLQLQYETTQKDKNIAALTQRTHLQISSLQKEKVIRNAIIGGAVLLLLVLILGYGRYRLKQQSNLQLQVKQEHINEQNILLKKIVGEKEWLLKEIHHRVKNNLQIVISLLNIQSAYLDNEDALLAIRNSQRRMHSMSLIHQKLYQSDSFSSIDMHWYIHELVRYMRASFGTDKRIEFDLDTDKVELDVALAVPLGLILNEAISNAIKYGFPGNARGRILVSLKQTGAHICHLRISDTGIGLPEDFDSENSDSLGMRLMRGLSEQLDSTFNIQSNNGVKIHIVFTIPAVTGTAQQNLNSI